ncbi:alpha/beta fold hydrolase [Okibacterium endophyticum]
MTARPHESGVAPITIRRGSFWIPGDPVVTEFGTLQHAPMHVEWEAPVERSHPYPLVLVHGGGGQATDWKRTADGRPGWADRFVEAGFAVYLVDRPGYGRSPRQPAAAAGAVGVPSGYESTIGVFAPPPFAPTQTQWPWDRSPDGPEVQQLTASSGSLPADLAAADDLDGERLAQLLDITGPAILVTHSLGAPAGWHAANRRPGVVRAIVAVEPMGPPFVEVPGVGALSWGLTASRILTEPKTDDPSILQDENRRWSIPGLAGLPVAVVTAPASPLSEAGASIVGFLRRGGATAELLRLQDHGVLGNGHGPMLEANSDRAVRPIIDWITGNG